MILDVTASAASQPVYVQEAALPTYLMSRKSKTSYR